MSGDLFDVPEEVADLAILLYADAECIDSDKYGDDVSLRVMTADNCWRAGESIWRPYIETAQFVVAARKVASL